MSERVLMDGRYMDDKTDLTGALTALSKIQAVTFKSLGCDDTRTRYGVVGQSLQSAAPYAVEVDATGFYYVELDQLIPLMIAAIKELKVKSESSGGTEAGGDSGDVDEPEAARAKTTTVKKAKTASAS